MEPRSSWQCTINSAPISEASGCCHPRSLSSVVYPNTTHQTKPLWSSSPSKPISPPKSASLRFSYGWHGLTVFTRDDQTDPEQDHYSAGEGAPANLFVQDDHAQEYCDDRS